MKKFRPKNLLWIAAAAILLLIAGSATAHRLQSYFHPLAATGISEEEEEALDLLKIENSILKARLENAKDALQRLKWLSPDNHFEGFEGLFDLHVSAVPAAVIARSVENWNSTLWVGAGSAHSPIIQKNSPVVLGDALVGIVEEVYPKKTLIRLITDPNLIPSVRAKRGDLFLAKGELHGSKKTSWRRRGALLAGEGFNYDFEDQYGPARDLKGNGQEPLIKVGDTLITTGMDGLFPEGLNVAEVTSIHILREGDYYYTIDALPYCKTIESLHLVYILPPINQ